ncbi:hypothetical protein SBRY_100051 [Actinacidiphila bryophytorum]|uniref:Uncharacterized protein n=1 Tax=Actinacidiphila bryophytorum TaxID=1436133 RepID=A0A9W4GXR5_9ACTN|nr:hypothetical protein SBRY_100051 [Actinacidiphila bryophytorum]
MGHHRDPVHQRHQLRLPDHPGRRHRHQRRAEVVPVGLLRLPLHQLLAGHQPARAAQLDQQRADQCLVQLRRQRRLRRRLRHLARPDGQEGRSQQDRDHGLVPPDQPRPAGRLQGRQRERRRAHMGRVDRQQRLQRRDLLRLTLGDQQLELRRQGLRQRDDQPRPGPEQLVPHQRPGRFRALAERRGPGRHVLLVLGEPRRQLDRRRYHERRHVHRYHQRRHHRGQRLVRLQGDRHPAELVRRLHRQRHRGQHRLQRRQRLEARLHPALRPDDHQRLERDRVALLRLGDRHQPVLQRPDPGRRLPVLRLPGHHQRRLRRPHRLHPERHSLLLTCRCAVRPERRAARPQANGAAAPDARRPGGMLYVPGFTCPVDQNHRGRCGGRRGPARRDAGLPAGGGGRQSLPARARPDDGVRCRLPRAVRHVPDECRAGQRLQRRHDLLPDRHQRGHLGRGGDRARIHRPVLQRGSLDGAVAVLVRIRRDRHRDQQPQRLRRRPGDPAPRSARLPHPAQPGEGPRRHQPAVGDRPLDGGRGRGVRLRAPALAQGRRRPGALLAVPGHVHRPGADDGHGRPERHRGHPLLPRRPVRHHAGRHPERLRADRRRRPRLVHASADHRDAPADPLAEDLRRRRHPLLAVPVPVARGPQRRLDLPQQVPVRAAGRKHQRRYD